MWWVLLKRNEILTHASTWTNPGDVRQREISESQKDRYCLIPFPWGTYSQGQKVEPWLSRTGIGGNGAWTSRKYGAAVWEDEKVLEMEGSGDGPMT